MLIGYDIDGVITEGKLPKSGDIIITGRSWEEAPETYKMLWKMGIFNVVFFNPIIKENKGLVESAVWKSEIINKLKVDFFYEDDPDQIKIMQYSTDCNIIQV